MPFSSIFALLCICLTRLFFCRRELRAPGCPCSKLKKCKEAYNIRSGKSFTYDLINIVSTVNKIILALAFRLKKYLVNFSSEIKIKTFIMHQKMYSTLFVCKISCMDILLSYILFRHLIASTS